MQLSWHMRVTGDIDRHASPRAGQGTCTRSPGSASGGSWSHSRVAPLPSGVGQRRAGFGGASLRRRTARFSDACGRIIVLAQRHSDPSHHTTRFHPRGDQDDGQAVPRRLWHSIAGDQPALQVSEHTLRANPRTRRMGLQRHERPVRLHGQESSMATTAQHTERFNRHPLAKVVADPVRGHPCVFSLRTKRSNALPGVRAVTDRVRLTPQATAPETAYPRAATPAAARRGCGPRCVGRCRGRGRRRGRRVWW
jgi:hypothetical protein